MAWNEDGTPREFTFDDVIADARNRGVLPPEPIFTEPAVETPAEPTDVPADPAVAPTSDVEADCTAILNDPAKSTVEQLAAIKKLVDNGITTATLKDAEGNPISVRLEVVPIAGSDRTMVHMFALDPQRVNKP